MEKFYIDCGSHKGDTVRRFMSLYPDRAVYAFDPNPFLKPLDIKGVHFERVAVWTDDCYVKFYYNYKDLHNVGATIIEEKKGGWLKYNASVDVPAIDFSRWVNSHVPLESDCIVKMDIEGAEYDVLWKMIKDKTIVRISELHIERHWDRIGYPRVLDEVLFERIRSFGVKVYDHS